MVSLYSKIVRPIIAMFIVVVILISATMIISINRNIEPEIDYWVENSFNSKLQEIDFWLEFNIRAINQLSDEISFVHERLESEDEILDILEIFRLNNVDYSSLSYISVDGYSVVTNNTSFDVTDREYFQTISQNPESTILSDSFISRADGESIILIVTGIFDNSENVIGYITGAIDTSHILETIQATVGIVNTNTYIKNISDEIIIGNSTENPATQKLMKSISLNPGWTLVMEVNDNYASESVISVIIILLIASAVMVIIFAIGVNRSAKIITKPVDNLTAAMEKVDSGILEAIHLEEDISEFNALTNGYNSMIANISTLMDEIRHTEQLKNEADNKALYAQIKPHFLYNTLETIQAMAFDGESEKVQLAIGNLATLFRIGLSNDRQIISLEEEISHLCSYLEIQILRYGKLFDYHIRTNGVDLSIDFMKFTLQPIVENAIYHGIKLSDKKGEVIIDISQINNDIIIKISNTYSSIDEKRILEIEQKLKDRYIPQNNLGYGLFNINARLKLNFGENYGVRVDYDEELFTTTIMHPVIRGEE